MWISLPRKFWFWVPPEVTVNHQLGLQQSQDQITQMGMRYPLPSSCGYRHILVDHRPSEWGAQFLIGYWTDDLHPSWQHLGLHMAVQNMAHCFPQHRGSEREKECTHPRLKSKQKFHGTHLRNLICKLETCSMVGRIRQDFKGESFEELLIKRMDC